MYKMELSWPKNSFNEGPKTPYYYPITGGTKAKNSKLDTSFFLGRPHPN